MISPIRTEPTLAAENKGGFLSSVLAWVRTPISTLGRRDVPSRQEDVVGPREFPGFAIYNTTRDREILAPLPDVCQRALAMTIKCDDYVLRFAELKYRGSLESTELTRSVCDSKCGASLKRWFDRVNIACENHQFGLSVPDRTGGIIWAGWNETCLTDPSTGTYCNDIIDRFKQVGSLEDMPTSELCSWCNVNKLALMQSSPYSSYDEYWKSDLEHIYKTCGITGNTEIPRALVHLSPTPPAFCASGNKYTTIKGDTCDSIAQAHNVSSAALYMGNEELRVCDDIPQSLEICLPLECGETYVVGPHDTCTSLEERLDLPFGFIRRLNAWLDRDCHNLQVSSAVFGHVLCLGAQGGKARIAASTRPPHHESGSRFDFSNGRLSNWTVYGGAFSAVTGALVAESSEGGKAILDVGFDDVIYEADLTLPKGTTGNAGVLLRVSSPGIGVDRYQGYFAGIDGHGYVFLGKANNDWAQLASHDARIKTGQAYRIKVNARGDKLVVYVDNDEKIRVRDATYSKGMVGVRVYQTGATFDNIEVAKIEG